VVRITLQDFMTYRYETIYPGAAFNVTVGPNGSGKSSIVTALSICLGGDLTSLNRQSELGSLVNTEGSGGVASVEVELWISEGQTRVVRSEIRSSGGVSWSIDKARASKKDVLDLAESLQIQPGNLCQFLPQDVVRDFPTMDNQQIFCNTVRAVGDTGLLGAFETLKNLQGKVEALEDQAVTKQNTLSGLEKKSNKLEGEKVIYNKRKEIELKKIEIENCIKWKNFSDLRKEVKDTRDKERTITTRVKDLEERRAPLKEFLADYEEKVSEFRNRLETADQEYNLACRKVEECDISEVEEQLDRLVDQEKDLAAQEENRVSQRARIEEEVRKLGSQVENLEENPKWNDVDKIVEEKTSRRVKHENSLQRSEHTLAEYSSHEASIARDVQRLERRLNDLEDKKELKLEVLRKENQDAYKGVMWLKNNRAIFNKPVYDPIMLAIDLKHTDFAKYVESHIGKMDLEGFICEDANDVNKLASELRENQNLRRINVFHSAPDPPESFRHPMSRSELERFDFLEYLSDMYDAPDAVHAYLCRQKNLHHVPVFKEENTNSGQLKQKFNNYYIGSQKFNVRKSKYSGELSTGTDDIGGRQVRRLLGAVDREEMGRVRDELETKTKMREQQRRRVETMQTTCNNVKAEIDKLNKEITELRSLKKEHSRLANELAMKQRTLEQLATPRTDLGAERRRIKEQRSKVARQLVKMMAEMQVLARESVKKEEDRKVLHLALQNIESENSEGRERLGQVERDLEGVRSELSEVQTRWDRDKRALQEKHSECRKATGILSNDVKYKPPEEWQAKFDLLGSNDINVLGAMLDDQDNELNLLKHIPEKVMEDIEALGRKLEAAKKEVDALEEEIKNKNHEALKLRRKWITGVNDLVEKINESFGSMMADLGYNGQVCLKQGERELDFSNYGIKILVRFRTGQELQELSKGTQSGGEKSVTTAVYMMALQELTQVPFRCVDEINQGMDEKNERAVWDQLLRVCKQHEAQYFYMAPKFPYSLPFSEQVTMLICNNGNVGKKSSHKAYRTSKFLESAKKRRRH